MGSSQKVVSAVSWQIVVNIVNAVYGFIAVPILISYYGKAEYGLIGLAMSVNLYMRLMDMGFNSTNIRYFSVWLVQNQHEKVERLFRSSMTFYGTIGVINAVVLFVVSLFSHKLFNLSEAQDVIFKHLLWILMFSAVISWFSSCFDQLIRATENVSWVNKRALIPKVLQVLILFLTVLLGLEIELYFLLTVFSLLILIPLSVHKIHKTVSFVSFIPGWDKDIVREVIPYSVSIFSFGIFQFSFRNLLPVFLGVLALVETVADYKILNNFTAFVTLFGGVFLSALLPSAARIVSNEDRNKIDFIVYSGTKYVTILLSFCVFGVMCISKEAIELYVGKDYLYLAPWLCLWLLVLMGNHNQAISSLILSGTNLKPLSYMSAVSAITGLVSAWLLIPIYHVGGAVIAHAIYSLMQSLFFYCYFWPRILQIDTICVFLKSFLPSTILGALSFGVAYFVNIDQLWYSILIKGVIFSILFLGGLLIILSDSDKKYLVGLVYKKRDNG